MSRLAKKPILIPEGVSVKADGRVLAVSGQKGANKVPILPFINVAVEGNSIIVTAKETMKQARANCGTMWSLIKNAVQGVAEGFSKNLEIEGVGFRAALEGKTLVLSIGFVNPARIEPPEGVVVAVEKNVIKVSGIDKELVGRVASEIRALKKPEPYKGKGIRYQGEIVRRKAGKKATATAG